MVSQKLRPESPTKTGRHPSKRKKKQRNFPAEPQGKAQAPLGQRLPMQKSQAEGVCDLIHLRLCHDLSDRHMGATPAVRSASQKKVPSAAYLDELAGWQLNSVAAKDLLRQMDVLRGPPKWWFSSWFSSFKEGTLKTQSAPMNEYRLAARRVFFLF